MKSIKAELKANHIDGPKKKQLWKYSYLRFSLNDEFVESLKIC